MTARCTSQGRARPRSLALIDHRCYACHSPSPRPPNGTVGEENKRRFEPRSPRKLQCRRCPASVQSTKATWQTSFGVTQRHCFIFSAVSDSPHRDALFAGRFVNGQRAAISLFRVGKISSRSLAQSRFSPSPQRGVLCFRKRPRAALHLGGLETPVFAWNYGVAIRKTKTGCQVRSPAASSPSNAI